MEPNSIVLEHLTAVREVARIYGVKAKELLDRVEDGPILRAAAQKTSDIDRAKLVSLAACVVASAITKRKKRPGSANLLMIEQIDDPIVRASLYAHLWLGRNVEAITKDQHLRPITVKQNLKRGQRILGL
ncbi:MAG: hypothetical protein ACR2HJ_04495 [Fimbriimonadales bacterium]